MDSAEVNTAPALELLVMSQGVGEKEPVGSEDLDTVIADSGRSALQEAPGGESGREAPGGESGWEAPGGESGREAPGGESGREVPGAAPPCSQAALKHDPAAPREEGPAGRPSPDEGGKVQTGGGGGQRGTEGGEEGGEEAAAAAAAAVAADGEETARDPERDAQTADEASRIKLEAQKQAHRLSPEFPEALYELLCTLQEGRRLNDQRCSFRLKSGAPRRRCLSEPNATKPARRVIFSSMTSLQQEEFFDLVAVAQARRLDDQRSQLQDPQVPTISKAKGRSFRGSLKQLSILRKPPQPAPVPKEDLYNMILNTQAQGRLEDQRSRAPGPMDDEDFFSLLLKVQGGRMEEQRTEFPQLLLQA